MGTDKADNLEAGSPGVELSEGGGKWELGELRRSAAPLAPVESMLAVNTVTLMAGAVPRGILRGFYERVLGMALVQDRDALANSEQISFVHQRRQVTLDRNQALPGKAAFQLRNFGEALMRLREHGVRYELSHTDDGLTRMAILRDPVGNWVLLVECRPL